MPSFIRQPAKGTPVSAAQWFPGQELAGVADEATGHPGGGGLLPAPAHAYLHTPKGRFTVFAGDWVITEPGGEMHTCPDFLFQQTYLPVEEVPADNAPVLSAAEAAGK